MTTVNQYEGWSNRETWNANLWISNTEPLYKLILRFMNTSTAQFADNLETFLWIIWDGATPDGYSLKPVDWVQIAMAWHEDFADP